MEIGGNHLYDKAVHGVLLYYYTIIRYYNNYYYNKMYTYDIQQRLFRVQTNFGDYIIITLCRFQWLRGEVLL